jgi:hypothetical protein
MIGKLDKNLVSIREVFLVDPACKMALKSLNLFQTLSDCNFFISISLRLLDTSTVDLSLMIK